jgi:uncharacterized protein (DUF2384 family)
MDRANSPSSIHSRPLDVRRLAFDIARRADAMGILDGDTVTTVDAATVRRLLTHARTAGVARMPVIEVGALESPTQAELASLLSLLMAALERSPVPAHEWPSLSRVFEPEQLAGLVHVSASSLRRYQHGARQTPDDVAERLHFLALVVADLAGAYNDIGIRRWFERPRALLGGKRPAALLAGDWDPEGPGAQKVRHLAQSLVAVSAT